MKDWITFPQIAAILFIVGLVWLLVWWQTYKYHDCKRVGHSTLYCVANIGD